MSIQVKVFDENKAKQELKSCPKIVRDYVKLLEDKQGSVKACCDYANQFLDKLGIKE